MLQMKKVRKSEAKMRAKKPLDREDITTKIRPEGKEESKQKSAKHKKIEKTEKLLKKKENNDNSVGSKLKKLKKVKGDLKPQSKKSQRKN